MAEDYRNSVKLIVKASNQQYDDQVVECPFTWSVLNLKTHLSESYPSKPTITEQKLIYAGQLLTDKLILRDILRNYDDIEPTNHIFHLVYTPKQRLMTSTSKSTNSQDATSTNENSTDGLRQRNVQNVQNRNQINNAINNGNQQTTGINQLETSNCPPISTFGFPIGATIGSGGNFNTNNVIEHQIALQTWMQQQYAQYINQYMNQYMSLYNVNGGSYPPTTAGVSMPQFPFVPYSTPSIPIPHIPNTGTASTGIPSNILPQSQQSTIGGTQQSQIVNQANAGIPANDNQAPAAPQQAAAPRFPQIVQEEQENRDWLDTFYSMSRLLVLLILVYFYSSPLRCLAVLFLGVMIYLYHIGFFRNHLNVGGIEANNNIRNNRNNNQQQQNQQAEAGAQRNIPVGNVAAANAANIQNENDDHSNSANVAGETVDGNSNNATGENQNDGTSVIAFLRTFVVSFLTSILPEAPTL